MFVKTVPHLKGVLKGTGDSLRPKERSNFLNHKGRTMFPLHFPTNDSFCPSIWPRLFAYSNPLMINLSSCGQSAKLVLWTGTSRGAKTNHCNNLPITVCQSVSIDHSIHLSIGLSTTCLSHLVFRKLNPHSSSVRGKQNVSLESVHGVSCIPDVLLFLEETKGRTKIWRSMSWRTRTNTSEIMKIEHTVYSTKATGVPPLLCIRRRQNPGKLKWQ